MGIRSTIASAFGALTEDKLRLIIEEILASRGYATRSDLENASSGDTSALEAEVASLKKKLNMAMGAVQAASADLEALQAQIAAAENLAKQANQIATIAKSTAESAADGVSSLEDAIEAVPAAPSPAGKPKATTAKSKAKPRSTATDDPGCKVDGCDSSHRARGFCAKHYQQWRRSTLPGFIGPDGEGLTPDGEPVSAGKAQAGGVVTTDGKKVLIDGKPV